MPRPRVLCLYLHYPPDIAPFGRFFRAILMHLGDHDYETCVFTGQPSYNDIELPPQPAHEDLDSVEVFRVPTLRVKSASLLWRSLVYLAFLARALMFLVRQRRFDVLLLNSFPPILGGLAARLFQALFGLPFVYNCNDIHPESGILAGKLPGGWIGGLIQCVEVANCNAAARVVVSSQDMLETMRKRGVDMDRLQLIENFSLDEDQASEVPPQFPVTESGFHVLYAGNHGHFQQLDDVIDAAHILGPNSGLRFVFLGEGVHKAALEHRAGSLRDRSVFFFPQQPAAVARAAMRACDLGVVSLSPGVYRYACPSKLAVYQAQGLPVLLLLEAESCLAQQVLTEGSGYVCPQGDPAGLARTLQAAAAVPVSMERRGEIQARARARQDPATALATWRAIVDGAVG